MNTEFFLRGLFRNYYEKNFIAEPPAIEQREFGIGPFGKKIADRHLAFANNKEFNAFLKKEVPFFVSYSAAYYKEPWRTPMLAKGFLGADLVYEFDADDLKTDCKQGHDSWQCECGAQGKGAIEACTKCGKSVRVEQWVCPECLQAVKQQVFRLLDFLENDFAFSEGIAINFSGSKGYHIHIRNETIKGLSQSARAELIDYLMGVGLIKENIGFFEENKMLYCPTKGNAFGWAKRLRSALVNFVENSDAEQFAVAASTRHGFAEKVLQSRPELLKAIDRGVLLQVRSGKNKELWEGILDFLIERERLNIDRQTSIDVSKIIRVPETLHGSTGLIAKKLDFNKLSEFNPLNDAIAFTEKPIRLHVKKAPRFLLKGQWFGPMENETLELPEFAAVFLLARNSAELA